MISATSLATIFVILFLTIINRGEVKEHEKPHQIQKKFSKIDDLAISIQAELLELFDNSAEIEYKFQAANGREIRFEWTCRYGELSDASKDKILLFARRKDAEIKSKFTIENKYGFSVININKSRVSYLLILPFDVIAQ